MDAIKNLANEFNYELPKDLVADVQKAYKSKKLKLPECYKKISQEILAMQVADVATEKMSARLALRAIRIATPPSFSACITKLFDNVSPGGKKRPVVSKALYEQVMKNKEFYDNLVQEHDNLDEDLDVFALSTLERAYLLRDASGIVERPIYMYMRLAISLVREDASQDEVVQLFKTLSSRRASFATPVMFNCGCEKNPSLASCFLYAMTSDKDSVDGIFSSLHDCAKISHMSGGIGISFHDIRARGSPINGGSGAANGILPVMQMFNTMAKTVDQGGGRRRGSIAVYLEPHHPDFIEFLEARQTYGSQELRTHDLFTAVWVSDLFMERVKNNEKWSFFCPELCPGLSEKWGDNYKNLYLDYEQKKMYTKQMKARDVFYRIIDLQMNASLPYLLFKDSCNRKSNQQNLGTIRSSNLCAEIVQYSDTNETAVCNLASICLPKFIKDTGFDFEELYNTTFQIATHLDNLIDVSYYPIASAELSNKKHRPIGIGTQGLADCFASLKYAWGSAKALLLDEQIHAVVYYAALDASNKLAEKYGPYESYEGSPASRGLLQYDLWEKKPYEIPTKSWDVLKQNIKMHGLRNSLSTALMPTASTAQIAGNSESIEPYSAMIFTRGTLAGEHVVVNKQLRKILLSKNRWNSDVKDNLLKNFGSVQQLPKEILSNPEKAVFRTAWEIKQKDLLEHAAVRGKYNCQSMSLNIFMKDPTRAKLTSLHFKAWSLGLKTSTYYLRMNSPASAIQFAVSNSQNSNPSCESNPVCESCSA